MSSRKNNVLRFAVGTPQEYGSAIWRLWVDKNSNVYLSTRELGGTIKMSLHLPHKWRLAWTSESGILAQGSTDRVEERWLPPSEFRSGWVQGPSVIIPYTEIQKPFSHPPNKDYSQVIWIALPKKTNKHHFTVLLMNPTLKKEDLVKVMKPGDIFLGSLDLGNKGKVILCQREIELVEKERSFIESFTRTMKIEYPTLIPEVVTTSVFTAGTDDAGHPYWLDIPLGWENVYKK